MKVYIYIFMIFQLHLDHSFGFSKWYKLRSVWPCEHHQLRDSSTLLKTFRSDVVLMDIVYRHTHDGFVIWYNALATVILRTLQTYVTGLLDKVDTILNFQFPLTAFGNLLYNITIRLRKFISSFKAKSCSENIKQSSR